MSTAVKMIPELNRFEDNDVDEEHDRLRGSGNYQQHEQRQTKKNHKNEDGAFLMEAEERAALARSQAVKQLLHGFYRQSRVQNVIFATPEQRYKAFVDYSTSTLQAAGCDLFLSTGLSCTIKLLDRYHLKYLEEEATKAEKYGLKVSHDRQQWHQQQGQHRHHQQQELLRRDQGRDAKGSSSVAHGSLTTSGRTVETSPKTTKVVISTVKAHLGWKGMKTTSKMVTMMDAESKGKSAINGQGKDNTSHPTRANAATKNSQRCKKSFLAWLESSNMPSASAFKKNCSEANAATVLMNLSIWESLKKTTTKSQTTAAAPASINDRAKKSSVASKMEKSWTPTDDMCTAYHPVTLTTSICDEDPSEDKSIVI